MAASVADRRRFTGPETSSPIRFVNNKKGKGHDDGQDGLATIIAGSRQDDRKPLDIRPIYLKTGLVPQASGSAYIETGKTKIVCAVYGPHPAKKDAPYSSKAKLNVEVKWAPFATPGRRRAPGKETESSTLSAQVSQAITPSLRLDLLPKSAIDLYITILECDGPLQDISPGITAASVALAKAGVQMYGFVVGSCVALAASDDGLLPVYDPTYEESRQAAGILSIASMPAMNSITSTNFSGSAPRQVVKDLTQAIQNVASEVHSVCVQAVQASNEQ